MKAHQIFETIIKKGISQDPRGKEVVQHYLEEEKERFDKLSQDEKQYYDEDRHWNPYADSRFLTGDKDKEVKRVLMGINIDTAEVLLADRMADKGKPIDLIIGHHPRGKALAALHDVMHLQEDFFANWGIPINVAELLTRERIGEVERQVMPMNHNQAVDAAALLGYPMMCTHTPADNHVQTFIQNKINESEPRYVKDIVKVLKTIPEYQKAIKLNAGPKYVVGKGDNRCGKVLVKFTGGTACSKDMYEEMVDVGVGTVVLMHLKEEHRKLVMEKNLNVIIAGHMASDSLGMNLAYKDLDMEVIRCSGLIPP